MIRPRDIEQGRPADPMLFRHPDRSFNFGALTGNDDLTRRVDISDINIGVGSQRTHRVFIGTDHRRNGALPLLPGRRAWGPCRAKGRGLLLRPLAVAIAPPVGPGGASEGARGACVFGWAAPPRGPSPRFRPRFFGAALMGSALAAAHL